MLQRREPARGTSTETVLDHAFGVSAFTATEAMEATGLTRSTVLAACDELARLGWIRELDDARAAGEYRIGRPARRYGLDERAAAVVGMDVGQHRVTVLVTTLRGTVLARAEESLGDSGRDPDARLRVSAATVTRALAEAATDPGEVLVTAIGVPAPVDASGRSPHGHDGYWASMNPGFQSVLAGHGEIVVENDANLAAVAERAVAERAAAGAAGAADAGSFAALLAGERFGTGLIVDGVLLRGAHGGAGEMRVLDLVAGVGSAEGIGSAARTIAAEALDAGLVRPGTPLGVAAARAEVDAPALFAAADAGDAVAVALVDRLGDRLARVCLVLASLLDIDRVVVAGAIARPAEAVIASANALLRERSHDPVPEIVASTLGVDVVVLGAVERALETVRAAPLTFGL